MKKLLAAVALMIVISGVTPSSASATCLQVTYLNNGGMPCC